VQLALGKRIMPIRFNGLLRENGIDPKDVHLVRHKDKRSSPGRSPYELWRDDPDAFYDYQSRQRITKRKMFTAPFWDVFVVDAFVDTLFIGLYAASYRGLLDQDRPNPNIIGTIDKAGSCDIYDLELDSRLRDLIGYIVIDWGSGKQLKPTLEKLLLLWMLKQGNIVNPLRDWQKILANRPIWGRKSSW